MFMDEFESIGASRKAENEQSYKKDFLNALLAILGSKDFPNLFIIGATNFREDLDEAILREGRLEHHIFMGPLTTQARRDMLARWRDEYGWSARVSDAIVDATMNFTGSQLKTLVDVLRNHALLSSTPGTLGGAATALAPGDRHSPTVDDAYSAITRFVRKQKRPNLAFNFKSGEVDVLLRSSPRRVASLCAAFGEYVSHTFFARDAPPLTGRASLLLSAASCVFEAESCSHPVFAHASREALELAEHGVDKSLAYYLLARLAARLGLQYARVVDSQVYQGKRDTGNEFRVLLSGILEEAEQQNGSLVVLELDELVGWVPNSHAVSEGRSDSRQTGSSSAAGASYTNQTSSNVSRADNVSQGLNWNRTQTVGSSDTHTTGRNFSDNWSVSRGTSAGQSHGGKTGSSANFGSNSSITDGKTWGTNDSDARTTNSSDAGSRGGSVQAGLTRTSGTSVSASTGQTFTYTFNDSNTEGTNSSTQQNFTLSYPALFKELVDFLRETVNYNRRGEAADNAVEGAAGSLPKLPYVVVLVREKHLLDLLRGAVDWGAREPPFALWSRVDLESIRPLRLTLVQHLLRVKPDLLRLSLAQSELTFAIDALPPFPALRALNLRDTHTSEHISLLRALDDCLETDGIGAHPLFADFAAQQTHHGALASVEFLEARWTNSETLHFNPRIELRGVEHRRTIALLARALDELSVAVRALLAEGAPDIEDAALVALRRQHALERVFDEPGCLRRAPGVLARAAASLDACRRNPPDPGLRTRLLANELRFAADWLAARAPVYRCATLDLLHELLARHERCDAAVLADRGVVSHAIVAELEKAALNEVWSFVRFLAARGLPVGSSTSTSAAAATPEPARARSPELGASDVLVAMQALYGASLPRLAEATERGLAATVLLLRLARRTPLAEASLHRALDGLAVGPDEAPASVYVRAGEQVRAVQFSTGTALAGVAVPLEELPTDTRSELFSPPSAHEALLACKRLAGYAPHVRHVCLATLQARATLSEVARDALAQAAVAAVGDLLLPASAALWQRGEQRVTAVLGLVGYGTATFPLGLYRTRREAEVAKPLKMALDRRGRLAALQSRETRQPDAELLMRLKEVSLNSTFTNEAICTYASAVARTYAATRTSAHNGPYCGPVALHEDLRSRAISDSTELAFECEVSRELSAGTALRALGRFASLAELVLDGSDLCDAHWPALVAMPALERLSVANTWVSALGFALAADPLLHEFGDVAQRKPTDVVSAVAQLRALATSRQELACLRVVRLGRSRRRALFPLSVRGSLAVALALRERLAALPGLSCLVVHLENSPLMENTQLYEAVRGEADMAMESAFCEHLSCEQGARVCKASVLFRVSTELPVWPGDDQQADGGLVALARRDG